MSKLSRRQKRQLNQQKKVSKKMYGFYDDYDDYYYAAPALVVTNAEVYSVYQEFLAYTKSYAHQALLRRLKLVGQRRNIEQDTQQDRAYPCHEDGI